VWPIAKAFTDLEDAEAEIIRSKRVEPEFEYRVVTVEALFVQYE
jgi:hypothetical protein